MGNKRRVPITGEHQFILGDDGKIIGIGSTSRTMETLFAGQANTPGENSGFDAMVPVVLDPSTGGMSAGGNETGLKSDELAIARNQKLLRAMQTARMRDPGARAPWIAPPAYANSTALLVGHVVAANGQWYAVQTAGTTASSGAGPSATTAASITDGTVVFNWLCSAAIAASGSGAPTLTLGTTNPALGQNFQPLAWASKYKPLGAYPIAYRTNFWELKTFNSAASTKASRGAVVAFSTDAPKLALFLPSNGLQYRIYCDDGEGARYLQPGAITIGGADSHLTIDWSAVSGRRPRTYFIETCKSYGYIGAVQVGNSDQLWPADTTANVTGVWISDSYSGGHAYTVLPGSNIAALVAKKLGIADLWNMSTGGTGYLATASGTAYNFLQRIQDADNAVQIAKADFIGLMGSTNDTGQTSAAVKAQALAALSALRAITKHKQVPIVVCGVPPINIADAAALEQAVADAVTDFDDPYVFFVPVGTDSTPWVTGSWNKSGTPGGTGDNSALYISGDGTHPTDGGGAYYATRIASEVLKRLSPSIG